MNETEWLRSTHCGEMLDLLSRGHRVERTPHGRRKLRLFACACARAFRHRMDEVACQNAVITAARFADGVELQESYKAARSAALTLPPLSTIADFDLAEESVPRQAVRFGTSFVACNKALEAARYCSAMAQVVVAREHASDVADLLRDVFDNSL